MACCVFTAYVMNRIIKACEILNLDVVKVQYNEFDNGPSSRDPETEESGTLLVSRFAVDGMTCSACVSTIEKAVRSLEGVEAVTVSLTLSRASVAHYTTLVAKSDICTAIERCGYDARPGTRTAQENLDNIRHDKELEQQKHSFGNAVKLAGVLSIVEGLEARVPAQNVLRTLLCLAVVAMGLWVQLIEARWIHARAWRKDWLISPNMDTLISLSLLLGIALSSIQLFLHGMSSADVYWTSGSLLTAVIIGGRYIDTLLRRQSARDIAELYALQCEAAIVKVQPHRRFWETEHKHLGSNEIAFTKVPAIGLRPGDEIYIEAGSIIPCDCYITSGVSIVDQATMTGETLPERKIVGDFLMSGTRNMVSEVVAIVSKTQDESALEQLVSNVSTATEMSTNSAATDFVNAYFVRLLIVIAGYCAYRSFALLSNDLPTSIRINYAAQRTMAVLASACPCALGLAIPSAVMTAISVATNRGIQIRGGYDVIRKLASVTHIIMDKTGTLTTGRLGVAEVFGTLDAATCMYVCAAERVDSLTHPVARAVFQWALQNLDEGQRHIQQRLCVTDMQSELGRGVACIIKSPVSAELVEVQIGSANFLTSRNILVPGPFSSRYKSESKAGIEVHIAISNVHVAMLRLSDTPRATAAATIFELRTSLGLQTSLLTGDSIQEAVRVAGLLDIPLLAASALPQQKLAHIAALQSTGAMVAMLGDGLNDTPALAAADVGILLSPGLSRANAVQVGVADVIISSEKLERVAEAVVIARRTMGLVSWNWWWAILYNILAVSFAAGLWEGLPLVGGRLDARGAGMLMAGSSVSVVGWSLWFRQSLAKLSVEETGSRDRRVTLSAFRPIPWQ